MWARLEGSCTQALFSPHCWWAVWSVFGLYWRQASVWELPALHAICDWNIQLSWMREHRHGASGLGRLSHNLSNHFFVLRFILTFGRSECKRDLNTFSDFVFCHFSTRQGWRNWAHFLPKNFKIFEKRKHKKCCKILKLFKHVLNFQRTHFVYPRTITTFKKQTFLKNCFLQVFHTPDYTILGPFLPENFKIHAEMHKKWWKFGKKIRIVSKIF